MKTNLGSTDLPTSRRASGVKTIALAMGSFMDVSAVMAALPIITALVRPDVSA